MNYIEFQEYVRQHCTYETIYEDTEGRAILVIRLLDAFTMTRKAAHAEREQWREVEAYLVAARDGGMSRNNSEALAGELLDAIKARNDLG